MEKTKPARQSYVYLSLDLSKPNQMQPREAQTAPLSPVVRHPAQEISPERFLAEIFTRKKGEQGFPREGAARFLEFEKQLRLQNRREELEQLHKECEDFIQRPRQRSLPPKEQEREYDFRKAFVDAIRTLKAHASVREVLQRNSRQPQAACDEYLELENAANRDGRHDLLRHALTEELKMMDSRFRHEFSLAFRVAKFKVAIEFIFSDSKLRPDRALKRYFELEDRYRREGGLDEVKILRQLCREKIDDLRKIPMNGFPKIFDEAFAKTPAVPVERSSHLREILRQKRDQLEKDVTTSKRLRVAQDHE